MCDVGAKVLKNPGAKHLKIKTKNRLSHLVEHSDTTKNYISKYICYFCDQFFALEVDNKHHYDSHNPVFLPLDPSPKGKCPVGKES